MRPPTVAAPAASHPTLVSAALSDPLATDGIAVRALLFTVLANWATAAWLRPGCCRTDYAAGLTQVQIAKKYGLQVQTLRKRLIEAGVDTRARLRVLTDENLRAARAAMDHGASAREITRGLSVAHTTVTRSLTRRHGAPESPLRTTSETPSDQGIRDKQAITSIEMLRLDPGSIRNTFSNIPPRTETLLIRWNRGAYLAQRCVQEPPTSDARGPVVRRIQTVQTFLTASEVDEVIGAYLA